MSSHNLNPTALYEQLPPESQRCLDEINFLASELRDHLLPEQFILAVNAMTQRLQKMHPQIPCQSGCTHCCESNLKPTLTLTEWLWIKEALQKLPSEIQIQIKQQVNNSSTETGCPLLVKGKCSVYSARPLDCRLQGYSFSGLLQPRPFSCSDEKQRIEQELQQQINPLGYMFMPHREKLKKTFQSLVPEDSTKVANDKTLTDYLNEHLRDS